MFELTNVKQEIITVENCDNDSQQSGQFCFVSCGTDSEECLETTEAAENEQDQGFADADLNRLGSNDIVDHSVLLNNLVLGKSVNNKLLLVSGSHSFEKITKTNSKQHDWELETGNFQCDVCLKIFEKLSHLNSHKLYHFGVKSYLCDICNRSFSRPATVRLHKQTHNFIKRYKCDECGKMFSQLQQVYNHKTTHSDVKKYKCNLCDKSFCHSSTLSRHKLGHSSVEKFECEVCNKVFLKFSSLSMHRLGHWQNKIDKSILKDH